ncbi:oxidoreductase [Acidocella aquatica]|uniref:Oxidoreductase n=1 Tax=Acidocella aquatica TaxID=1922313 RepID=A0ABQ6A8K9_9PROT|nr:SDR family NAD(P)-dependent oxidoreductase [Acidocella aquatica]GLR68072.1 oxidoreductase [Acidocella aquatica]
MSVLQRVTNLVRPANLTGLTSLVVGATAGIGAHIAQQLAASGARTIITGRDPASITRSLVDIRAVATGPVDGLLADIADLASVRRAAAEIRATHQRIDIVVANAGVMVAGTSRSFTKDGFETHFGVDHLGNAALLLALERPIRNAGGRVVIVASEAHRRAKGLPMDDLMGAREYNGIRAYRRSKLANILFARGLAERWPDATVYSVHPGGVLTNMLRRRMIESRLYHVLLTLIRSKLLTPEEAAAGIVRVAVDPALAAPSGSYFELGRLARPGSLARDDQLCRQLFNVTLEILTDSLPVPDATSLQSLKPMPEPAKTHEKPPLSEPRPRETYNGH